MAAALSSTEAALTRSMEAAVKASAKRAEDEGRKAAAKERAEQQKALTVQLTQARTRPAHCAQGSGCRCDNCRDDAQHVCEHCTRVSAQVRVRASAPAAQLSGSLQRDISRALADMLREQARATAAATVSGVTPAVVAALQQEMGGSGARCGCWRRVARVVVAVRAAVSTAHGASAQPLLH